MQTQHIRAKYVFYMNFRKTCLYITPRTLFWRKSHTWLFWNSQAAKVEIPFTKNQLKATMGEKKKPSNKTTNLKEEQ
jgi:hypothetical protein